MSFPKSCLIGIISFGILFSVPSLMAGDNPFIWVEGEAATTTKVARHPWWYDLVKKDLISGGDLISHFSKKGPGEVSYKVEVPKAGKYYFYVRANPIGSKIDYEINGQGLKKIDTESSSDRVNVAADGKSDMRFLAWFDIGQVDLKKGENQVRFVFKSDNENHGYLDAFTFCEKIFSPSGTSKPNEVAAVASVGDADTWAFNPPRETFGESPIDLHKLNSPIDGFVRLSKDGESFVDSQGKPIRFWSAHSQAASWSGKSNRKSDEDYDRHFRWLAKYGVNMSRMHVQICIWKEGSDIMAIDEDILDGVFRTVATSKKYGIYQTLTPFWAHAPTPKSWDLGGLTGKNPYGAIYFNEKLQNAYKHWTKELLTRVNPYTGIALKDDPTLAIMHVHNEDSLFFWTFGALPKDQKDMFGKQFGDWCMERYGSLEKTLAAWDQHHEKDDNLEMGIFFPISNYQLNSPQKGGLEKRVEDQISFMVYLEKKYYEGIAQFWKSLGAKQLFNATCWRASNEETLGGIQRYTNTGLDVMTTNRYTGGMANGQNSGWRMDEGYQFTSRTNNEAIHKLPTSVKQAVGHPFIITEASWVHPARYQSEGPFLMAAHMSLSGVDSVYFFDHQAVTWRTENVVMPWFTKGGSWYRFSGAVPQQVGMYPATALAFRKGYIASASKNAVLEKRKFSSMLERKMPAIVEASSFDGNRDTIVMKPSGKSAISPLAFMVGPVKVEYDAKEDGLETVDLNKYIDEKEGVVTSLTGEIVTHYKEGWSTVDAPKFAGISGMVEKVGQAVLSTSGLRITSTNEYATICAVCLDDLPLKKSAKILVQVGTIARLTGWMTKDVMGKFGSETLPAKEIVKIGKPPYRWSNTIATIELQNSKLTQAVVLNDAGYPTDKVIPLTKIKGGVSLELPKDAMYIVLQ